ncbi:DUF3558 domain-containing protein [Spiractinospora alimapuensis]|uniref:DUF3558 family protein n=1 Tax=Spiractinospora alimapuensis TaxID=2820884 RepID=UPI001F1E0123|nr:DUF3558 family protein [Spiractinospora alimapuensis]QVQ54478.1 DUF3558 domain-containing protein [Spiractinospora alimapuensis]
MSLLTVALLTAGCGGGATPEDGADEQGDPETAEAEDVPLEQRDSIAQFDVPALDPTAVEPCELLPDEEARDLGALPDDGAGVSQTESSCFYSDPMTGTISVKVNEGMATDRTMAWLTLQSAFTDAEEVEEVTDYVDVSGYPAYTTDYGGACNLDLALSDDHGLFFQAQSDDPCYLAVRAGEVVVANTPEL